MLVPSRRQRQQHETLETSLYSIWTRVPGAIPPPMVRHCLFQRKACRPILSKSPIAFPRPIMSSASQCESPHLWLPENAQGYYQRLQSLVSGPATSRHLISLTLMYLASRSRIRPARIRACPFGPAAPVWSARRRRKPSTAPTLERRRAPQRSTGSSALAGPGREPSPLDLRECAGPLSETTATGEWTRYV
jgi:hypothetical protein